MAKPEPFFYADRRLELPAIDGTVPYEKSQLDEILGGVRTLLSRSNTMQEDCKRQIEGHERRWLAQHDLLRDSYNALYQENNNLRRVIRKLTDTGVTSVEHLQAWGELQEILGDLS